MVKDISFLLDQLIVSHCPIFGQWNLQTAAKVQDVLLVQPNFWSRSIPEICFMLGSESENPNLESIHSANTSLLSSFAGIPEFTLCEN
jgi:hypothetical protein